MQRLTTISWSLDNQYILSGSDEMNIRIWKAHASEKIGQVWYSLMSYVIIRHIVEQTEQTLDFFR